MKKLLALCLLLVLISFMANAMAEPYKTEYGITFGMTPQEVQDIETQNGKELKGTWENADSYQLYYEKDVHFYSLRCTRMEYDFDVSNHLLFQVYYVSNGGAADYAYAKSLITSMYGDPESNANNTGNYSILYDQIGDSHIEESHWLISGEAALGIDLWYNDYNTVFIMFFDASNPASFGALPKQYSDNTGLEFSYPEGSWDAMDLSILGDLTPAKISFTLRGDTQTSIQYMRLDLWGNLQEYYEPMGFKRGDFGEDFLEDDIVSMLMQPTIPQNLRTKYYSGIRFRLFEHQTDNNGKSPDLYYCSIAMTVRDGYLHMFQLSSVSKHDQLMPDFENLLSTVAFSK